ncbi:MAG TPA: bifunctional UDP-N-acetylglucosamine diphosphorylase/glucosamine-1-phosphate N-acetyltransferase GlmU [Spongiibacteraceae bacterium]|nr:bifunctional UDP-N-acetylglucosamine diphosphorylase/glucosamine-1-phosphate N-acetyltransferase GlmU [Spongiibacteraceae bacterium]
MKLEVVILAAGQGTRMRSALPKVLHPLAGKALVHHVIDTATALDAKAIHTVIGHGAERVQQQLAALPTAWALQEQQLGTGHAVAQAMPKVADDSIVLVLYGDVPLVKAATLQKLLTAVDANNMALLTVELNDPTGYGRILRDANGGVTAIVEQKDASAEQLKIREGNTGILAAPASLLKKWLPQLSANNAQGEYYLTDIIGLAVQQGIGVNAQQAPAAWEVQGINNRLQLSELERIHQRNVAEQLMTDGVTLADPARIDVRGTLTVGRDIFIDVNCVFEGDVTLGDNVRIGPNCVIRNARIAANAEIESHTSIDEAIIGEAAHIGPYARLRPGTELGAKTKIGNFVETKKAVFGEGSKANHLAYIGDSEIGSGSNIGAGTITCNYDGVNKHKTEIGNNVFVGSNSTLVAPLTIGDNAFVGAGSTITSAIPTNELGVARGRQRNIAGWRRPMKKT